jgi:hypothetical protein
MRNVKFIAAATAGLLVAAPGRSAAQSFPSDDSVIKAMWEEGMVNSQAYRLAQVLLDSIGPRLTGSPGQKAANDWAVAMYRSWGIEARNEQYGTWRGWRRGVTHIDLLEPRVRTLEGTMLAWSPGTNGKVRAGTVIVPEVADSAEFAAWLPNVKGRFVLMSFAEPTCRTDDNWEEYATEESFENMKARRDTARNAWSERLRRTGIGLRQLGGVLEDAGAVGILTSRWSRGWGVTRFSAHVPSVFLCSI